MNVTSVLKELSAHFINLTPKGLTYGPQGRLLLKNLKEHWFLHCVTMSRYNIFLADKANSTLNFIAKTTLGEIPFGLTKIRNLENDWNKNIANVFEFNKIAEVVIFNSNEETKDLFHKVQKERKIWWRRLAQCPSRFKLAEVKKLKNSNVVNIEAQFSFGNITVEKISYHTNVQNLFSQNDIGKDLSHIQMVEHMVSLDWGCLALLCDAYDNKDTKKQIHIKLAPYKVAFHIKNSSDEMNTQNDELIRFVHYLNNMLRTKGLNTILTTSEQIIDTCLVPFIVSVDTTSLESGIIYVIDRSTTLSEAVHIADLVKHISMRC